MAQPPDRNPADPWRHLTAATPARIALGRAGGSLPTREVLRFALAHARARDAVHADFDSRTLADMLRAEGLVTVDATSRAADRAAYLRRPDWGRDLSEASRAVLKPDGAAGELVVAVADGLSATAVEAHAVPLVKALRPLLEKMGIPLSSAVIATGARVALGDAIGQALGAQAVLVLIGERPGLSSPDSLGAYLTFDARPGRMDSERNCVSNIRPEGLPVEAAALRLGWLIGEAFRRRLTGVALKDESEALPAAPADPSLSPHG
ncbi:MAG: ethanolamine ammonia-lyase subunit EutC [Phreatobacter sp.]|uniref:ethanolamine ammonia-lyase subunit EutC n=1 Tax=Phreatobacter sp. TaxID=1966341 RepID=UPI001A483028|nr:ethanolamine ammonia-lyase subunit EutC [Phreatobacter sp.]MBL8570638.1 ethanolamine ammonia-lyase subunit EutC [Phreatobacter sp.]